MNENIAKKNEALAQTVIKGLESRNMTGFYAASKEDALKTALSLIPENSTIAMGGCTSATEIGLIDALKNGKYNYIDRAQMEPRAGLMAAYDADIFFGKRKRNDKRRRNSEHRRKRKQSFVHSSRSKKSCFYSRNEQNLCRFGQRNKKGAQHSSSGKRTEVQH